MCCRFTITTPIDELQLKYLIQESTIFNYKLLYNAGPNAVCSGDCK